MPEHAAVAYVIAGTVHNDQFDGARISVTRHRKGKGRGGVVIVYDKKGRRVKAVLYEQMPRVEVTYGKTGEPR